MSSLCKFGTQMTVGNGIFFMCSKSQNHCQNHCRWCSMTNKYEGVGDYHACEFFEEKVQVETAPKIKVQEINIELKSKENKSKNKHTIK